MRSITLSLVFGLALGILLAVFALFALFPLLVLTRFGLAGSGPLVAVHNLWNNAPSAFWLDWVLLAAQAVLSLAACFAVFLFLRRTLLTQPRLDPYFRGAYLAAYLLLFFGPTALVITAAFVGWSPVGLTSIGLGVVGMLVVALTVVLRQVLPVATSSPQREILFSRGKE